MRWGKNRSTRTPSAGEDLRVDDEGLSILIAESPGARKGLEGEGAFRRGDPLVLLAEEADRIEERLRQIEALLAEEFTHARDVLQASETRLAEEADRLREQRAALEEFECEYVRRRDRRASSTSGSARRGKAKHQTRPVPEPAAERARTLSGTVEETEPMAQVLVLDLNRTETHVACPRCGGPEVNGACGPCKQVLAELQELAEADSA